MKFKEVGGFAQKLENSKNTIKNALILLTFTQIRNCIIVYQLDEKNTLKNNSNQTFLVGVTLTRVLNQLQPAKMNSYQFESLT